MKTGIRLSLSLALSAILVVAIAGVAFAGTPATDSEQEIQEALSACSEQLQDSGLPAETQAALMTKAEQTIREMAALGADPSEIGDALEKVLASGDQAKIETAMQEMPALYKEAIANGMNPEEASEYVKDSLKNGQEDANDEDLNNGDEGDQGDVDDNDQGEHDGDQGEHGDSGDHGDAGHDGSDND